MPIDFEFEIFGERMYVRSLEPSKPRNKIYIRTESYSAKALNLHSVWCLRFPSTLVSESH
ncbi:hypothetical protein OUZ56_017687 [Daphnia magna]|uniref:Uncharacterized protein n=1 Tax=Daphnia magna TaxID=35525 RepID=A0ABR0ATF4_9CRUS|nr:hypothetical protein OUZ56_017687 [Daphnia magna]